MKQIVDDVYAAILAHFLAFRAEIKSIERDPKYPLIIIQTVTQGRFRITVEKIG